MGSAYFLLKIIIISNVIWSVEQAKHQILQGNDAFKIAGILKIVDKDGNVNYQSGMQMALAMKYAVKHIKNTYSLNGYKISYKIFNCESDEDVRAQILEAFKEDYAFLVGPYSSLTSYTASILTGTFKMVTISYSATYTHFFKHGLKKGFMLRTVPSDVYRMRAALDFIKYMKWNYVGVVSSFSYNGERDAVKFIPMLKTINTCLALHVYLENDNGNERYSSIVKQMAAEDRLKTVVLFTTQNDSKLFLKELHKHNLKNRFYILCIYGCTNYVEVVEGNEEIASGVISLDLHYSNVRGFEKYFLQQKATSSSPKYFRKYWEKTFGCNLRPVNNEFKSCSGENVLSEKKFYRLTPFSNIVNAVSIVGRTIENIIDSNCRSTSTKNKNKTTCSMKASEIHYQPDYLFRKAKRLSGMFSDGTAFSQSSLVENKVGNIQYDFHQFLRTNNATEHKFIASWSMQINVADRFTSPENIVENRKPSFEIILDWNKTSMRSICSEACNAGYVRDRDTDLSKATCCWRCRKCPINNIAIDDKCIACKNTEEADIRNNICADLAIYELEFDTNVLPYVILVLCIVGIILDLIVVGYFIKYNAFPLVRASGRDLCYLIMIGIGTVFLCPLLFVCKPSLVRCIIRSGLPGVAFLCCYAPLFLKIQRIYRIFTHAQNSASKPHMVGTRSLLLVSLGIIVVQIILMGVWFLSNTPIPILHISDNKKYVTVHCAGADSPILLILSLAMSVLFMFACTYLAFKTRHYPKNYNEAKHIGITLYITCVAWSIFIPAYFLMPERDYLREYFMSGICITIGLITVFGLFGYKVRLLTCQHLLNAGRNDLPTWSLSQNSTFHGAGTEHTTQSTMDSADQIDTLM